MLAAVFEGADVAIEHVGSTAVPGLAAKPILDVLLGVGDLAVVERRIEKLAQAGLSYVPEYEAELPERRYFKRRPDLHLHCVVEGGRLWSRHLLFRDSLRSDPEAAAAYQRLKLELAARHGRNRRAYLDGKSVFIESILERAQDSKASRL